ncbi:MmcQ/YjbR family DNA-binding protein [Nocardioides marmoriginsengisoli]|uniref:MmcQ/YjbR family DNA-binding protein n=1 Tax=Nocardioides marmoriginsengisoli TaxID=661483 RepID=A0A3N0CF50_9ACTN|nr:MmcQ/YjbR family DNA-binding protein [Nocardioides marmoriginsengisoli]RNL62084.1 MmcQ/YjbR family DNA-binding protein [Nocardioides marmoriginsengisoli]
MPCEITDFVELAEQLPEVGQRDSGKWVRFGVADQAFGYLWPATNTVGLKQTIAEQLMLVAERPEAFEIQYTSGAFGWVVVHLDRVERDELAELTFEAWRLSAPERLVTARADELPT